MGTQREEIEDIGFELGLVDGYEPTVLPPGTLLRCRNWIPEIFGNLRARRGWNKTLRDGLSGTLRGRGIGQITQQVTSYASPSLRQSKSEIVTGTSTTIDNAGEGWLTSEAGNCLVAVLLLATDITGLVVPSGFVLAHNSPNGLNRIYVAENAAALSSVSFSWTNSQAAVFSLQEFRDVATATALDQIANASGTGTTFNSGTTAATTTTRDVAIAVVKGTNGADVPGFPTNGFSNVLGGAGAGGGFRISRKFMTAAEAASTSSTVSGSQTWQGVIVTLKAKVASVAALSANYVVAHADTTGGEYEIYSIDGAHLADGAWSVLDTIATSAQGDPVAFTTGLQKLFYTNIRFATARQWDPSAGASSIAGSAAGRCIAFHKERLFVGGVVTDPTRLDWSDVGSTSFSAGSAGNQHFGRDDGEPLEDVIVIEDSLLVGKANSLWMFTGAGPDNFRVIRLPSGGCAPGRSMVATPWGAIVADRRQVWLVAGGSVDLISQRIGGSYQMSGDWMEARFIDDLVYILDQGSGKIWVFDPRNGVWHDEIVDTAAEAPAVLFAHDDRLFYAPSAATITGLLGWRLEPGGTRGKDFDTLTETFQAHFEFAPAADVRFSPLHLYGKWRQRGGDASQTGITVTPVYDGVVGTPRTLAPRAAAGTFRERVPIAQAGVSEGISLLEIRIEQTVPSTQASLIEPEKLAVGFIAEQLG